MCGSCSSSRCGISNGSCGFVVALLVERRRSRGYVVSIGDISIAQEGLIMNGHKYCVRYKHLFIIPYKTYLRSHVALDFCFDDVVETGVASCPVRAECISLGTPPVM